MLVGFELECMERCITHSEMQAWITLHALSVTWFHLLKSLVFSMWLLCEVPAGRYHNAEASS